MRANAVRVEHPNFFGHGTKVAGSCAQTIEDIQTVKCSQRVQIDSGRHCN